MQRSLGVGGEPWARRGALQGVHRGLAGPTGAAGGGFTFILQGRGQTFLSWRCNYSYTQMVANSEACPWDGSSTLVSLLAVDTQTDSAQVSMGEDALAGGRPQDGVYFLTTRGEEPRSYDSHLQWQQSARDI